jgi:uncharacterized membrane protein required for colicin V production
MFWLLDSLAVTFILFWGYKGFKNGLIEELGRLIGLITAILISMSNSLNLSIKISNIIQIDHWLSVFISISIIFMAVIYIGRFFTKLVKIAFLSGGNQLMNRSLGFFFGSIKGVFTLIVFIWVIALLPLPKWTTFIHNNSQLAMEGNKARVMVVSFFHWEDPIELSESYIKKFTKP